MNQYEKEIDLKKKIDQVTTQTTYLLIDELIEKAEKSENTLLYRLALLNELDQLVEEKNKKVKTKFPIATPSNLSVIISDNTLFRNYLNQVLGFLKHTVIDESMRQYRDLIEQAVLYIKQNFSDPELSLGDVASHTNLSSSHFSTVFSQSLGRTFVEYLTEQRLTEAKRLLKETDWKLSNIASEIGYNDPNYFSYIFKRKEGISPKEYRKTRSIL